MAALAPTATANGQRYRRVSSAFTRPNDTTAYASGDLVADSTTAASVTPLSWLTSGSRPFFIPVVRLQKSAASAINAQFRLSLFSAAPTVSTTGDNAAFASDVNGFASFMGAFEGTLYGFKDGAAGLLIPIEGVIKPEYIGDPTTIYGLLEARAAYAPAAQEVFTATLVMEFDQ